MAAIRRTKVGGSFKTGNTITITSNDHHKIVNELARLATDSLPAPKMREIFKKALVPVSRASKYNIRRLEDMDGKNEGWQNKLAKAATWKAPKNRSAFRMSFGYVQKKLPTTSSDGTPYKAHGVTGVPVTHWREGGTKERKNRGTISADWPIWRAFNDNYKEVGILLHRYLDQRLREVSRRNEYVKFKG
jgi:hypothetical protein